jgi:4-amino-4-deoxy-L-arabinose transferase-like glycosyltransferase
MRLAMRRVPASVLLGSLVLAVVVRAGVVVNRAIDPDESQHLHAAWRVAGGQVPYRDFWEHHVPLFHAAMAPLVAALTDRPEVYWAARGLMALCAAAVVVVTWRIARRLSADGAVWAALILLALPQFAETSTETRPDVPALLAHVLSLWTLVRWRERGGDRWLWLTGAGQGLALALSLKAAFGVLGVAAAVAGPTGPGAGPRAGRMGALLRVAAGAAAPCALVLGWLTGRGGSAALAGFARDVIRGSLGFVDRSKTWPVYGSEIGTFAVAGLALLLLARMRGWGLLRHPAHGALLIPAAVIAAALAAPWTPAVYQHAWLPVLPVVATYAGLGVAALAEWARRRAVPRWRALAAAGLAAALLVPLGESVLFAVRDQNAGQLLAARQALRLACPGEPVLDGTALAVFRPAAYRFGALITGVRYWVAQGVVAEETIVADLEAARPRVAYPDRRLRAMIGPVADFLRRYYVRGPDGFLLAGARIPAAGGEGRATVSLLVPALYLVTVPPGTTVAVDGRPIRPGWHDLTAGRHEVGWTGAGGTIGLVAATCLERRLLRGDAHGRPALGAPGGRERRREPEPPPTEARAALTLERPAG